MRQFNQFVGPSHVKAAVSGRTEVWRMYR